MQMNRLPLLWMHMPASSGPKLASRRTTAPTCSAYASTGTGIAVGLTSRIRSRAFARTAYSSMAFVVENATNPRNQGRVVRTAGAAKRRSGCGGEHVERHRLVFEH